MNTLFESKRYTNTSSPNAERQRFFVETPLRRFEVPGFTNVWIKDESVNPLSGTHKDRLAWDAVNLYRGMLNAGRSRSALPQFSIISSGSAAIAIGRAFRNNGFPKLKVLMDERTSLKMKDSVLASHCEVFTVDLEKRELSGKDILTFTSNTGGLDLTSHQEIATDIGTYDSLGVSLLNESPDYVFVPFGTGMTLRKVLYTAENLLTHDSRARDPRYSGDIGTLGNCHYLGATTTNPRSSADKLYAPFYPFREVNDSQIGFYKSAGYCGALTGVYDVEERFFIEAMELAKRQGVVCEPSGVAGLALFLKVKDVIPPHKKIVIVNTGKLKLDP